MKIAVTNSVEASGASRHSHRHRNAFVEEALTASSQFHESGALIAPFIRHGEEDEWMLCVQFGLCSLIEQENRAILFDPKREENL
ncbi:MAG TPA: hypothetical protein PKY96_12620 [Flavobacteriales bacterium]|nr:hypothetical protein [Flavobacteriales bacterium]